MSACNCCQARCDPPSVYINYCGFPAYDGSGTRWETETVAYSGTVIIIGNGGDDEDGNPTEGCYGSGTRNYGYVWDLKEPDEFGPCVPTAKRWSGSYSNTYTNPSGSGRVTQTFTYQEDGSFTGPDLEGHCSPGCDPVQVDTTTITKTVKTQTSSFGATVSPWLPCFSSSGSLVTTSTLTNEVPGFTLSFYPPSTCYLQVWLQTRFVPSDGGAHVVTPQAPYLWNPEAGELCLPSPDKGYYDNENKIREGISATPGTGPGSVTVEIVKYSCVDGYIPDISDELNKQPNGFPDPTWEPSAP